MDDFVEGKVIWSDELHLQVRYHISPNQPPEHLVTSVRCILQQDDKVMVMRNADNVRHIVPGGRCEAGETVLQTLEREMLEETGWQISTPRYLGFWHFHHLKPKVPDYAYPYPDFFQLIYTASAAEFHPEAQIVDDYEQHAEFQSLDVIHSLELAIGERYFLKAL